MNVNKNDRHKGCYRYHLFLNFLIFPCISPPKKIFLWVLINDFEL